MIKPEQPADICIISEGSYPYYSGGVAGWAHELIKEHKERRFHVLTLMPPNPDLTFHYQFPPNVVGHTVYIVQDLPLGRSSSRAPKEMWELIGTTIKHLISAPDFEDFGPLITFFQKHRDVLGKRNLGESKEMWNFFLNLYREKLPSGPFRDFFSTIYVLCRSLFSLLLPVLPKAKFYHALCTGYAGFLLYRAKQEFQVPCILTEQGIYTNERRIEIAMADWISDVGSMNLAFEEKKVSLKDFWLNAFFSLAHVCYRSCEEVITTFDGNQEIQLSGGADPKKMRTIVHGINLEEYASLKRSGLKAQPIVAFVGRIVPIKDVKTFIRACQLVHQVLPTVQFHALGPTSEDLVYFDECQNLVELLGLRDFFTFFGKVDMKDHFSDLDLIVLTSISEAQPRIMMEAGALGIPSVSTNVGACRQLCYGREDESPCLGQGGIVTPLANPQATAQAIITLLTNKELYQACSVAIAQRIQTYYRYETQHAAYREIYNKYMAG